MFVRRPVYLHPSCKCYLCVRVSGAVSFCFFPIVCPKNSGWKVGVGWMQTHVRCLIKTGKGNTDFRLTRPLLNSGLSSCTSPELRAAFLHLSGLPSCTSRGCLPSCTSRGCLPANLRAAFLHLSGLPAFLHLSGLPAFLHLSGLPSCTSQGCLPSCTSQGCLPAPLRAAFLHLSGLPSCTSQGCLPAPLRAAFLHLSGLPSCTSCPFVFSLCPHSPLCHVSESTSSALTLLFVMSLSQLPLSSLSSLSCL